jgi:phosphatidylglycerophosphate synthase
MRWIAEYNKSLKMAVVEEYIDLIFYRPLAFIVVKLIYNSGVTPDNLTFAAIISGLIAGVFYAFGTQPTTIIAACFFILFIILDCSDGQLARLKKNGSAIGRLLDGIADYIGASGIYIGIAIGYSQKENQPHFMLLLLALSGVSLIIQLMLVDFHRTRFLDILNKRRNTFMEGIDEYKEEYRRLQNTKGKWLEKNIVHIYLIYSGIQKKLIVKKKLFPLVVSPEEYYKKNRVLVRLWILMGPSAIRTTLIICSLLNRFDIYFWISIAALNIYSLLLLIIQRIVDKSYSTH